MPDSHFISSGQLRLLTTPVRRILPPPADADGRSAREDPGWSDEPLGVAVSDLMASRGLTQTALARCSGVSQTHISRVIHGQSAASTPLIEALATALGVAPTHFLDFRLDAVMRVVERSPCLLDELFEQSLSAVECRAWEALVHSKERLGQTVQSLVVQRGVTLDELGEDAELAPGHLRRIIERNAVVSSVELIERLARAIDVPPEYFLEYRAALLREWLREDPQRLDAVFSRLCGQWEETRTALATRVALAPYAEWPTRPLRHPRQATRSEIMRAIVEIARIEGPVIGSRVYSVYARAAGLRWITRGVRSLLNRAAADAVRRGLLLAESETREPTQKDLVLRIPRTPRVAPRERGERQFGEIPLGELRWVIARVREAATDADGVRRHVLVTYGMDALTELEQHRFEQALGKESR